MAPLKCSSRGLGIYLVAYKLCRKLPLLLLLLLHRQGLNALPLVLA